MKRCEATYAAHTSLNPERKISCNEIHSEGKELWKVALFLYVLLVDKSHQIIFIISS